ncbi:MAG: hypothetical protein ACI4XP_03230 [Acutalibacteraceae bacterium]
MAEEMNTNTSGETNTTAEQNGGANDNGLQEKQGQQGQTETKEVNKETTAETIERLVQSRVDRITAELGKKNADLKKQLDKLTKEKMSDDEVKQLEMAEKEKAIQEKERVLLERENRLLAINAIKEVGLDDGSTEALALVDFVIADNEENIKTKATTLKSLIDKKVAAEVAKTFKQNGRTPNGASQGQGQGTDKDTSIAAKLGKAKAAQNKTANDVLKYYTGR